MGLAATLSWGHAVGVYLADGGLAARESNLCRTVTSRPIGRLKASQVIRIIFARQLAFLNIES